jgi:hypothetical protein
VNLAKAGQAIPLSFEVLDQNSVPEANLALCTTTPCPVGSLQVLIYATPPNQCTVDGDSSIGSVIPATADMAGNSGLQNLGGGSYQFNWKTPKTLASGSCETVQVNLGDGINHIAVFKFK